MAHRDYDENRLPLGDITNSRNQDSGSKKRARVFEDDDDLRKFRRQKARERYANMPPDKKVELNAKKKRENYHRKKANKQSVGSLHVAR
ncbi:hypothetical protein PVAP13_3KG289900 [Panicum virgatum]|uniref:Uncharacterized protein n=1 Tax=Panicum virgatum TaxID=38727 RepID=A0A8T0UUH7_PANVG|nr:hypothetical protein PVAP13_3KG289900 [Panicum virgatum]